MSKIISSQLELIDVCRSAALWYVGSYMLEFIMKREQWENPDTKDAFVHYMFTEYGGGDKDESGTRTRVNAMIRIIESKKVKEALNLVLDADDRKLGCPQAKINAQVTLDWLATGKIHC